MAAVDPFEAFRRAFNAPDAPEGGLGAFVAGEGKDEPSVKLLQALTPRMPDGILPEGHRELHAPQQAFLLLDDREAFYGGAAGGGKTEALLKAAVQYVDYPNYRALILRRTYPELAMPGAIMERAKAWFAGRAAKWNADEHQLTFPSGASVTFAHAQYPDDVLRFGGTEFHFVGFDELTRFYEDQYTFLFSRLRKTKDDPIPLRMRSASNPGDIGHAWVKARFVDPLGQRAGPFIPAKIADNPSLNIEQYVENLMMLHPTTRQRLLKGDWDITQAGAFFQRLWFPIIDKAPAHLQRVVRYWDLASTAPNGQNDPDWTRGFKMGIDWEKMYYGINMQGIRAAAGERDALIKQTAILDGRACRILFEQEPGSAGKSQIVYFQKMLPGWRVEGVRSSADKETRASPVASQAQAGNLKLVNGPWVNDLLMEADAFPTKGVHDDCIDAMSGAFAYLALQASSKLVSFN